MKIIVLPYLSHSPDFGPRNFRIFLELARHLKGRRFQSADEVKSASQAALKDITKMDSRNVSMNFTSDAESVLLLKSIISKEDMFQQISWRRFVEWNQNEIAVVPDFHKRILFSDEAHFWLNGYVNKQNCRIWSEANPQVYVETPLHPEKLTVWCALWVGGIMGPYFFKNDENHNVTVNGDRYRAMITNFFIPELNNHDVQELWFQQDGATCHTARATINLLKDTFGDRLISRFGPVNWPPRSCNLTPLDYFLWGYVKSLVYADKPQTLDHLEDNIRRVIADIRPQVLEKVIENWTSRLDYIRASRGSPMPEIIFKL
ncbi:putative DD41D transposase [Trichonephila clavipes]|nr:putative DD41D transposase [Trichonephila clavipes]